MDSRNPLVTGYYRRRADAILKCALVALRFGYRAFAVQHQGWCATGPRAHLTYRKYGRTNRCRNGKGGPWANDVYAVSGKRNFLIKFHCGRLQVDREWSGSGPANFILCCNVICCCIALQIVYNVYKHVKPENASFTAFLRGTMCAKAYVVLCTRYVPIMFYDNCGHLIWHIPLLWLYRHLQETYDFTLLLQIPIHLQRSSL